ncbi:MAG: hypothetical protein PH343_02705 [Nitrospira sp.]|nr:hypothetical protein [Nitrospira sp.]
MVRSKKLFKIKAAFFAVVLLSGLSFLSSKVFAQATEGATAPATEEAAAPPAPVGGPDTGRKLYTGEIRFTNGGPPCISCHDVGYGALGGGALGPNLTQPNEKYGVGPAVGPAPSNPLIAAAWINSSGTPVMGAIFSKKNITDEEVENLKAFFKSIPGSPSNKTGVVVGIGAVGFIGILIFFGIVWSNRFRNRVGGGTAHQAIWRNYGGKGGQR